MTKGVQGLKKSIIAVVTGFTVAAGILSGGITGRLGGGQQVQAAEVACTTYTGDNIEDQNYEYSQWAKPIRSYLTYENGTYMRVQAGADANGYVVEYFDSSFTITGRKIVPQELPLFGGFYEMNGNYYILSGQTNKNESDSVEVYRITKYTKDWNRVASCGLYGENTTVPFDAGSARMAAYGDYLMIRTSHEMYKSKKDGYNHQANVTIQVDTSAMKITDSYTKVMNVSFGYVSHSFNQFIQMENGKIVAVDHGDAHPRSIVLVRYPSVVTSNGFTDVFSTCKATDIMAFEGKSGDNYTGATVGGFEISDTAYLTAGSVDIDSTAKYSAGQDIFVGVVSKSTDAVKVNKITNYTAGQGTTDTPQFVKIGTNSYMLLWHRGSSVYYTKIDGNGNQVGAIYSLAGDLSDCVPVLAGDKLVWYTWKNEILQFYQININDLSDYTVKNVVLGHSYQVSATNASDASVVLTCSKCGQSHTEYVVKSFAVYWYGSADNGYYYTNYESRYDTGTKLKFLLRNQTYSSESDSTNQNSEMVWESSDTSIATVSNLTDESGTVNMLKPGIVKISIYPKYNPSCKETATFTITEAKKDDGSETKPGDGSETKPGDGSETKPGDGSGLYEAMLEAKEQGKIRFIGITNHRMSIAEEAIESGLYDTLQFPFNYLSTEREIALAKACAEHEMGFIAMKGLSGGLLTNSAAIYAYMAQFENVLPIWGVQKESELDEFLSYIGNPPELTDELKAVIEKDQKELAGEFCRGCGYCMPCPAGIEINNCARMSLLLRRSPSAGHLSPEGQAKMKKIEDCLHCGHCKSMCPYGLDTPKLLEENYKDYKEVLAGKRL